MFNFFRKSKKENTDSPASEDYLQAKTQFDEAKHTEALSTLINGFKKDIYFEPLYQLASDCLTKLGGNEEAILFQKAQKSLNTQSFKNLGNHFYQVEHYPLSKIFLEEAFKKDKDPVVAHNLAIAYARRFDTKKAQEVLEQVKDKFDFWTFWFYIKTKILNNDREDLNQMISQLEQSFDPNSTDENLVIPRLKVKELREAYNRLLTIEKPEMHIRDWHFIQYGSVILDFFFDENQYVAGGRHVASWGNLKSTKEILLKLCKLITSKSITNIVYANDRDSKILGLTLSQLIGKPAIPYDSKSNYNACLLLSADSSSFNEFTNVEYITNNNLTFSFNQNWLQANFICPDVIGLMSQSYFYSWNGGNFEMNEDGTTRKSEPDSREASIIAHEIYETEIDAKTETDDFYINVSDQLKLNQESGHRYNFMIESPIPGSYFGSN